MAPKMQNPGLAPRASRNQLVGWLHLFSTASDWRAQTLVFRACLPPWMARLYFGEGCND
jgi:hypothetical protein